MPAAILNLTTGIVFLKSFSGTLNGVNMTLTGVLLLPDGSAAAPSIAFASEPTLGFRRKGAQTVYLADNATAVDFGIGPADGNNGVKLNSGGTSGLILGTSSRVAWTTGGENNTQDTVLVRDAANTLALKNANADQVLRSYGMNGGYWERGSVSELLTLSIAGTTTDTTANLLPANAIIESVVARVTTTITTATDWKLGDATIAGRFTAAQSGAQLTAGATVVGLVHIDQTGTSGPRQTAAAKLRVTTTGTPGAGVIRITTFYRAFIAPTS